MMKISFLALLSLASARDVEIGTPDNEVPDIDNFGEGLPTLLTGEKAELATAPAVPASGLLETHASVQANQNLRSKILAQMSALRSKGQSKTQTVQAQTMAVKDNLLGQQKATTWTTDNTLNKALEMAIEQKAEQKDSKRVTLEEILAVEDKAKDAVDSVSTSLNKHFLDMMETQKDCISCKADCKALNWKKYRVHTMAECQQNCKIHCEGATPEEKAQFEQERQAEPKCATPEEKAQFEQERQAE